MRALLLLALLLLAGPAAAQTAAPRDASKLPAQVEKLAAQARADGMTVIVIPSAPAPAAPPVMDTMRTERFLAARARLAATFASAGTLLPAMAETWERVTAAGGPLWWLRGLATAALGALLGWLALRPVVRRAGAAARRRRERRPQAFEGRTTADRAAVLLTKTAIAVLFALLIYAVALLVAVVLDSGFEPTRRVIFECLTAFVIYRLLRFGFAWPLTAYDDPPNRLVNLSDGQAVQVYRSFTLWAASALVVLVPLRFFVTEGAGPLGALTAGHVRLLVIAAVLLATLAVVAHVLFNFRAMQAMFMPQAGPERWRGPARALARAVPVIVVAYSASALVAFLFRLGLGLPAPAAAIVAPFVIGYVALVVYAVALIAIQAFYGARESRYLARMEAERRERLASIRAARERLADGEEMRLGPDDHLGDDLDAGEADEPPPYQPLLRGFLEQAALAIVLTVALGELGRWWGVPVGASGNAWAAFLDIVLALALAWIATRAIGLAIDRRIAEEGGPESDAEGLGEDALGNEGGAGASRVATLLPILRWVMVAVVVVAAAIAVLSEFGVDIGPLLASAGVVGIAVGFGAQKLIQDVFSGAFFLLDDAFRRGEYIEVEGTKGTVEKISIRSFQLRHHLGALHTLPFGEIRQLTNYSRDWVLMKLPLRVTYDTDVERVRKLVKKLGQELLEHPEVGHTFLQPLKSQGVYKMEDSAMIIRVKFMTKPGEQFVTRKVVYAAIQELFARENIRFAHKEVTVRLADGERAEDLTPEQRRAVSSAAREVMDAEEAAAPQAAE